MIADDDREGYDTLAELVAQYGIDVPEKYVAAVQDVIDNPQPEWGEIGWAGVPTGSEQLFALRGNTESGYKWKYIVRPLDRKQDAKASI